LVYTGTIGVTEIREWEGEEEEGMNRRRNGTMAEKLECASVLLPFPFAFHQTEMKNMMKYECFSEAIFMDSVA
jgi:DNA-binding transcriptional regulator LsrR (DeoR family)